MTEGRNEGKKYTRNTRKQSQSEQNKSAITNHVNTENHINNWKEAIIICRESDMADQGGRDKKAKTS